MISVCCSFFFFKQKTAYEMRISDWSSDVCSSDLQGGEVHVEPDRQHVLLRRQAVGGEDQQGAGQRGAERQREAQRVERREGGRQGQRQTGEGGEKGGGGRPADAAAAGQRQQPGDQHRLGVADGPGQRDREVGQGAEEVGRASCRARGVQYVSKSGVRVE